MHLSHQKTHKNLLMMKNILLTFSIFLLVLTSSAQTEDNRIAIPLHLTLNQYDAPGLREILKLDETSLGFETGLKYYLNPSFNLAGNLHFFKLDAPGFERSVQDYDASLEYKLFNGNIFKQDAKVKPYITGGFGVLHDGEAADKNLMVVPLGAGFRFDLSDQLEASLQSRYKFTAKENTSDYLTTSIGVLWTPKSKKDSDGDGVADRLDTCPNQAGTFATNGCPDTDGDGIADREDDCPRLAGTAQFNGCPDTDGDGIVDTQDACPNEAGSTENKGCPDTDGDGIIDKDDSCPSIAGESGLNGCPDADGDGVADKDDNCPKVAGPSGNAGCPEKDTDNDGVIDKEDECPTIAGTKGNKGCPEINEEVKEVLREALEGVQFRSGSDVLLTSSYSKLDKVVSVMKENSSFKLKISGYTDNTGNQQSNLVLSQKRAHAAEKYLVDKGVAASRVTAEGYGIVNPVADNSTREGRAKNRRVEFEVVFN